MSYEISLFSGNQIRYFFETEERLPLIISPNGSTSIDFIEWATSHQEEIAKAIDQYGAVVFQGFGLTKETFREAFSAATGMAVDRYKGDTPRKEVGEYIYHSTAVGGDYKIPLHQEVSSGDRKDMPKYLSFFCEVPPMPGTGRTLLGKAESVTQKIQRSMPEFWRKISTQHLTYTARYLPSGEWRTSWIKWLNPSHGTIEERFNTRERGGVLKKCQEEGLSLQWDGKWAVVSRSGVPGTIVVDGKSLFCNQIHLDKFNEALCGGIKDYYLARLLVYPTVSFQQFDVEFDGQDPINESDAADLLNLLDGCEVERDWQKGEMLIIDNRKIMHGKTPHDDKIREIYVAMAGSVIHS